MSLILLVRLPGEMPRTLLLVLLLMLLLVLLESCAHVFLCHVFAAQPAL